MHVTQQFPQPTTRLGACMTARMIRSRNESVHRNSTQRAAQGKFLLAWKDQEHLDGGIVVTFGVKVMRLDTLTLRETAVAAAASGWHVRRRRRRLLSLGHGGLVCWAHDL